MVHVVMHNEAVGAEPYVNDRLRFDAGLPAAQTARLPPRRQVASRSKPLREAMPEVAGFIDGLRDVFGRDSIDVSLARGLAGEPTFFASESGREVGTRVSCAQTDEWRAVGVRDRYYCTGCEGDCVGTETRCTDSTLVEYDVLAGPGSGF